MGTFIIIISIIYVILVSLTFFLDSRSPSTDEIISIDERKNNNNILSYTKIKGKCRRNFKITIDNGNDNE